MKINPKLICCFLLLVFLSGCKKSKSTEETSKPAASTNAAPATKAPVCDRSCCYIQQRGRCRIR
jgi:hypothetical protein